MMENHNLEGQGPDKTPLSKVDEHIATGEAKNSSSLEHTVSESTKGYRSTPEIKKQFREFFGETRYAEYAKEIEALKLKHPELKNIPTEDLVAVRGYTSSDYSMLNKALRSGDPAELERLHAYIKTAESGLSQLPSHQGAVFRGTNLSSEVALKYKPGQPVTEEFFFSTSAERSGAFPGDTKYFVDSTNGKRVDFLSEFPHEREVLFPPGTKFDVLSVQINPSTGQREIFMNEIPTRK
jgi:NAD:arginine ADP-ribosyltransferase